MEKTGVQVAKSCSKVCKAFLVHQKMCGRTASLSVNKEPTVIISFFLLFSTKQDFWFYRHDEKSWYFNHNLL